MGASGYQTAVKTKSESKLKKWFDERWQEDKAYYGNNPYSGSLATLSGVQILNDPYPNRKWTNKKRKDVVEFLYGKAEKWECALAVKTSKDYIVVALLAE